MCNEYIDSTVDMNLKIILYKLISHKFFDESVYLIFWNTSITISMSVISPKTQFNSFCKP